MPDNRHTFSLAVRLAHLLAAILLSLLTATGTRPAWYAQTRVISGTGYRMEPCSTIPTPVY